MSMLLGERRRGPRLCLHANPAVDAWQFTATEGHPPELVMRAGTWHRLIATTPWLAEQLAATPSVTVGLSDRSPDADDIDDVVVLTSTRPTVYGLISIDPRTRLETITIGRELHRNAPQLLAVGSADRHGFLLWAADDHPARGALLSTTGIDLYDFTGLVLPDQRDRLDAAPTDAGLADRFADDRTASFMTSPKLQVVGRICER